MSGDSPFSFSARPLRWFYIDFNSYFASVEQQEQPHLRDRPVIVVPTDTDSTCAIAASVQAKRFGIRTGTKVYDAKRLCPQVVTVLASHRRYVEYHHRLLKEIERHIPITRVGSIDEVACRLLNNENSLEFVTALAQQIKAGIAQHVGDVVTCSIGVAPSPLLAKLASDAQKPDGFVVYQAPELPQCLYAMQLDDICGIGRNMLVRLQQRGIATIADFCALGPRRAGAIWGSRAGDRLWFELHGMEMPPIVTHTHSLGHSHVLPPAQRVPEQALLVLRRLTLKAATRLRRKGYRTGQIDIMLRPESGEPKWVATRTCLATQDSFTLVGLVDAVWRQLWQGQSRSGRSVRFKQVAITFSRLEPHDVPQTSLFPLMEPVELHEPSARPLALSQAMDRLNEKYQKQVVTLASNGLLEASEIGAKIAFSRIPELPEFHE